MQLVNEMYKTIRNLKTRTAFHVRQSVDVRQKALEAASNPNYILSEQEKEAIEHVQMVEDQLENGVVRTDESLMLLSF